MEHPGDNEITSSRIVRTPRGFASEEGPRYKGIHYRLLRDGWHVNECVRLPKIRKPVVPFVPICGQFLGAGTHPATNFVVAGAGAWNTSFESSVADQPGILYDHCVFQGRPYASGQFEPGVTGLKKLVRKEAGEWVGVSGHDLDEIYAVLVFNNLLYVGGSRITAGDNVRVYDGSSWSDATGAKGIGLNVRRLYNWGGSLIAVGESSLSDGYNGVQVLSGGSWAALGTGLTLTGGTNPGNGYDCCDFEGDLVVVGRFSVAGSADAVNVARWSGSAWSGMGDVGTASDALYAACVFQAEGAEDPELYVGGTFNYLWKYDGADFNEVGEELITFLDLVGTRIWTLCVSEDETRLIVGGLFHKRVSEDYGGNVPEMCVVLFDGEHYEHYFGGLGRNYGITASNPGVSGATYRATVQNLPDTSSVWEASTDYEAGDRIIATTFNDRQYVCSLAGASSASEPSWPTGTGETVTDGTCKWRCEAVPVRTCFSGSFSVASDIYSPGIAQLLGTRFAPVAAGVRVDGFIVPAWQPNTNYDKYARVQPTTPNGYNYRPKDNGSSGATIIGTSGSSEPVWSTTPGGETADGGIIWVTIDEGYPSSPSGFEVFVWGAVKFAGGHCIHGAFAGFMNRPGKGAQLYGVATNVALYRNGALYPMGERAGMQLGGCAFGEKAVVCGDSTDAPVAKFDGAGPWEANTPYEMNETVIPTTANGFQYRCIVAGTSHATTEPTWPTQIGSAVLDGSTLEWQCEFVGWVAVGVNIEPGGVHWTLADFDGKLWLGGDSISIGATPYDFAVSSGAANSAGNWTGHTITNVVSVHRFMVADLTPFWQPDTSYTPGDRVRPRRPNGFHYVCTEGGTSGTAEPAWPRSIGATVEDNECEWTCAAATEKLYSASFSTPGVYGCVHVCEAGSTTFTEIGGDGNRVSGEASSITAWIDEDLIISIVVCGGLDVNGTPCSAAEYRAGTWSIIADVLDLSGQALAVGTWAKMKSAFLMGGGFASVADRTATNLLAYEGETDEWGDLKNDAGGASSGILRIGPSTKHG